MDLRIIKTKTAIREAFLSLRSKQTLEKIKVVDICSLAMINKTTFYNYYQDIYALSDAIDREVMDRFWNDFEEKDCLISDPVRFITALPKSVDSLGDVMYTLYRDRLSDFFRLLADKMVAHYVDETVDNARKIRLFFIIYGLIHLFDEQKKNPKEYSDWSTGEFADIIRNILPESKSSFGENNT